MVAVNDFNNLCFIDNGSLYYSSDLNVKVLLVKC